MSDSEPPIDRGEKEGAEEEEAEPAPLEAVDATAVVPSTRPEPAPPRRPHRRLRLALAVASLFAAIALGVVVYDWLRDPVFPLDDIGSLPKDFVAVRRVRSRSFANAFPGFPELTVEQAMWSRLAHDVCGGIDLYAALITARYSPAHAASARMLLADRKSMGQALQCGKEISRKIGRRAFEVSMPAVGSTAGAGEPVSLEVFDLDLRHGLAGPGPERSEPPPKGLDELVCGDEDGAPLICLPTMRVAGRLAGTDLYAFGSLEYVKRLGEGFSASKGNAPARAEDLEALADDVSAYKTAEVGKHEMFSSAVLLSLGGERASVAMFEPSPASKHLREALVACDVVWAYGDGIKSDGGEASLWLRAGREADVAALLAAVEDWRHDAAIALATPWPSGLDPLPPVDDKFFEATNAMAVASLKSAAIERKGRDVIVRFVRVMPDASVAIVADMRKEIASRARSSARVIDATLRDQPPDRADLEVIGGPALVQSMDGSGKDPRWPSP